MPGLTERIDGLGREIGNFFTDLRISPRQPLAFERVLDAAGKPLTLITLPIEVPLEKLAEQLIKRGIIRAEETYYSLSCRNNCGAFAYGIGIGVEKLNFFPFDKMTPIFVSRVRFKEGDRENVSSCTFHTRGKWDLIPVRDMVDGED